MGCRTVRSKPDLGFCTKITDTGLGHVAQLTQLTSLDLSFCKKITDTGLEHVAQLTQLTSLDLYNYDKITDTGLEHVAHVAQVDMFSKCFYNKRSLMSCHSSLTILPSQTSTIPYHTGIQITATSEFDFLSRFTTDRLNSQMQHPAGLERVSRWSSDLWQGGAPESGPPVGTFSSAIRNLARPYGHRRAPIQFVGRFAVLLVFKGWRCSHCDGLSDWPPASVFQTSGGLAAGMIWYGMVWYS